MWEENDRSTEFLEYKQLFEICTLYGNQAT
jgi:hypothetical protein